MILKDKQIPQVNLVLSDKNALIDLLGKADIAISNIYNRRKSTIKYFKEELFVAKNTHQDFAQWTIDETDNLTVAIPPPPAVGVLTSNINPKGPYVDVTHVTRQYKNLIQYQFKNVVANLKNAERVLKLAIRYQGQVELSADILNNMDYFSNSEECVRKLDNYCKKTVENFIKNNSPNR